MGIYTDLATQGTQYASGPPRVGLDRSSTQQLLSKAVQHDPLIGAAYAAADEVSVIPEQTDAATADTYTITLNFPTLDIVVTTAGIAFNAINTTIETAIDSAMTTASFPSWTNADISVTMAGAAGLDDGTVTLTFDGVSVDSLPCLVSITPTGFNEVGSTSRTQGGQGDRKATQALFELNVVSGTLQASGDAPTDWVRPDSNGQSRPRWDLIQGLALQAATEDGTDDVYNTVVALYPRS